MHQETETFIAERVTEWMGGVAFQTLFAGVLAGLSVGAQRAAALLDEDQASLAERKRQRRRESVDEPIVPTPLDVLEVERAALEAQVVAHTNEAKLRAQIAALKQKLAEPG